MALSLLLITFGGLLLASLALDALGRFTRLPRITLLVLFGLAIGPAGLDLLPIDTARWREVTAELALTMVAFALGGTLSRKALREQGRAILAVSVSVTLLSVAIIAGGLLALGLALAPALLLAAIALATDPATVQDVVRESRAKGPMTRTLLGVVAIDDAWGVMVFSVILGLVAAEGGGLAAGLGAGLAEVALALGLGAALGLPAAYLTGRIRPGEPTVAEALGLVLLASGLSLWLGVSFLLTGMAAGAVIVNLARHHSSTFHEIEHLSWPVLILFFVLAGAAVDPAALWGAGALGAALVVLRLAGRLLGGVAGGLVAGIGARRGLLAGLALTPQAGVALGMALVAAQAMPDLAGTILTLSVATTVAFELAGPILTRTALRLAGETGGRGGTPGMPDRPD
ncbi:transporter, CPA2 family [Rhodovulum sp. ES.010]|uniref:cation:proton antiporter n=1 Tax=Rhodovulum sp. ES.010 TaxID=1882821 RepID=UPI0009285522|nr:cation:proton antiporter [Rhodovulum sp. ES.010]SIO34037.1 transporter, CPA2 family [Rhodovulum sp. ES.010]